MRRRPPRSTLFPCTTLCRSARAGARHGGARPPPRPRLQRHFLLGGGERRRQGGFRPRADRARPADGQGREGERSEEHTSELQSRHISYAVFCLKKKTTPSNQ